MTDMKINLFELNHETLRRLCLNFYYSFSTLTRR